MNLPVLIYTGIFLPLETFLHFSLFVEYFQRTPKTKDWNYNILSQNHIISITSVYLIVPESYWSNLIMFTQNLIIINENKIQGVYLFLCLV